MFLRLHRGMMPLGECVNQVDAFLTLNDSILDRIRSFPDHQKEGINQARELLKRLDDRRLYRFMDEALCKDNGQEANEGGENKVNRISTETLSVIKEEIIRFARESQEFQQEFRDWKAKDIALYVIIFFNFYEFHWPLEEFNTEGWSSPSDPDILLK